MNGEVGMVVDSSGGCAEEIKLIVIKKAKDQREDLEAKGKECEVKKVQGRTNLCLAQNGEIRFVTFFRGCSRAREGTRTNRAFNTLAARSY